METTLTKRTLASAVVKASSISQEGKNSYKLTITIEKSGHNLLVGGDVNVKISGLNVIAVDYINSNGVSQVINDLFNQQRVFNVKDSSTLTCDVDINSSTFSNILTIVAGTPLVQVNNDKIIIPEGYYNFELLNKTDYPAFSTWDLNYRIKIQELGIGSKGLYQGRSDYYSDGTLTTLADLNEQDLNFQFCQNGVEISIVDGSNQYIGVNDFTKTTNVALIINKL